jgi:hypothetical protein
MPLKFESVGANGGCEPRLQSIRIREDHNEQAREADIIGSLMKHGIGHSDQDMAASNARILPLLFSLVIVVNLVCGIYASIYGRGLYADAAAQLIVIYAGGEPATSGSRATVEILRQTPVVLLARYTNASLFECGELLTFVMLALPTILCAICWPIAPQTQKAWILFPLASLLAGFAATSMHAVGEAAIATSYYWILFFLLLFQTRTMPGQGLFLLMCVPAYRLHEGTFPLTTVLLIALAMRTQSISNNARERLFVGSSFLLLMTVLATQILEIIDPAVPDDRAHIIQGLMHFEFLYSDRHFNLPLITGAMAMMGLGALTLIRAKLPNVEAMRYVKVIVVTWTIFALVAITVAISVEKSFSPFAQLQARYHPPLTSAILAVAMILLRRFRVPDRLWMNRVTIFIFISLCATQAVADTIATRRWSAYVADLQSRLAEWHGLIPWEETLATGDKWADANWRLFNIGWVVPFPCIIFAPNGIVNAIIDLPQDTTFRPLDPERPDLLPKLRGINFETYKRYFASQFPHKL